LVLHMSLDLETVHCYLHIIVIVVCFDIL